VRFAQVSLSLRSHAVILAGALRIWPFSAARWAWADGRDSELSGDSADAPCEQ